MTMNLSDPDSGVPFLLELFNGISVILEGIFLLWGARYLYLEMNRRELRVRDWFLFRLPPSMNFIIAVLVFDIASWLRSLVVWSWRRLYNSGDFTRWHLILLLVAAVIGFVGALCKIRAVTRPDQGDGPWLLCLAISLVFVLGSVAARMPWPS